MLIEMRTKFISFIVLNDNVSRKIKINQGDFTKKEPYRFCHLSKILRNVSKSEVVLQTLHKQEVKDVMLVHFIFPDVPMPI